MTTAAGGRIRQGLLSRNLDAGRGSSAQPMHEMSIAQSLVEIIQEEMARHHATKLRSVRLHVGEMSAIVPDSLSFCFEVITAGTRMEGARLIMEIIPVEGKCRACGETFKIKDFIFVCPRCGGTGVDAVSGQELSIVELEVDEVGGAT